MLRQRLIVGLTACLFTVAVEAMDMQELFDAVNAYGNTTDAGILQGQTMNYYTGGSLFMRMPDRTYNLASFTPPSWKAGCGGIDLFMGGFSHINKEQFVAMLRNIGSNAVGYAFKLAIQNLCPTCENVMQSLEAVSRSMNRLNIDSCETAKGVVTAALPESWTRDMQNNAKNWGVDTNIFSDLTDAWTRVMNNEKNAGQTVKDAEAKQPSFKDVSPTGNVVWKALKGLDGIDDEYRMLLMSITGTVIFDTPGGGQPVVFKSLAKTGLDVATLVGAHTGDAKILVPIWQCDTTTADGCLAPVAATIPLTSFKTMVRKKMEKLVDKLAGREPHDNIGELIAFLNVTDLPVYKMLAVTTSYGNTGLADAMIGRYQELIAAKYAEAYILRAVKDLRAAISNYTTKATGSTASALDNITPTLDEAARDARLVLAAAYQQTISTYNIALEVQHMERALNANLSQSLRTSLAFARSVR